MISVEVGAGTKPRLAAINVDVRSPFTVDDSITADGIPRTLRLDPKRYQWVLGDLRNLPIKERSVDEVISRHNIEHLSWKYTDVLLDEWARILRSGGRIVIICPNIESFCRRIPGAKPAEQLRLAKLLFGRQEHSGDFHIMGFTPASLGYLLKKHNFQDVQIGVLPVYSIKDAYCRVEGIRK